MDTLTNPQSAPHPALKPEKFKDPAVTAKGETRASVALTRLDTLWVNTGTLCNIACIHCYIESGPQNDRLVYFTTGELQALLDEIDQMELGTREIAFTGGEPFMNPDMLSMMELSLSRGFDVLVLTNAMQPMQRKRIKEGLLRLNRMYRTKLMLRVSLDHYSRELHERERGADTFDRTLTGMDWLSANAVRMAVAGRTCWGESEADARAGYRKLFAARGYDIDADDPMQLVLFPEMDERLDVPEITTACWQILNVDPRSMMCATSRMVVKHKGATAPTIVPCTLLPYDPLFEMGTTLREAAGVDGGNFDNGTVRLNHPHCARFCVLGGGSCSVA